MKLLSLHIDNFGKLRDFDLDFTDGLNSIIAENGYGKSTLAAFIKAMLYGLSKAGSRVKSLDENERKHFSPWQGGAFGGYIDIETEKGRYRVSRSFGSKPAADTFSLINLDTKLESNDYSENIGVELFGIDADSYEKSTYLPQRDITLGMTSDIGAKLNRLLESSDDLQELDRAVKLLENYSKTFRLYKGNGGLINETQLKLDNVLSNIEKCRKALSGAEYERAELEKIKNEILELGNDIAMLERENERINKLKAVADDHRTLEGYKKAIEESEQTLKQREKLLKSIPTDENVAELEKITRELTLAKARLSFEKESSEDAKKLEEHKKRFGDVPPSRERLTEISSKITELENAENDLRAMRVPEEPQRLTQNGSSYKLFLPLSCILAALGAVLCFVLLPAGIALIAVGAVLLAAGVALSSKAKANEKRENELYISKLNEYNDSLKRREDLTDCAERLRRELDAVIFGYYPNHIGNYSSAFMRLCADTEDYAKLLEEAQNQAGKEALRQKELDSLTRAVRESFSKFKDTDSDDLEGELESIRNVRKAIDAAKADLEAKKRFAKNFAEEKGLADSSPEIPDASEIETSLFLTRELQNKKNAELGAKEKQIEQYEAQAELLPELTDEADRLRGSIELYEEKRNTAERAKEYLKRASDNLSSRYLRGMELSFSENYSKLSDVAMPSPDIDSELHLSFRDGGSQRGSEWYSEGIRSLISVCMRLALTDALFENEVPFLILDDPFTELDEAKLDRAKRLITDLAKNRQIIYLTCHESRKIE